MEAGANTVVFEEGEAGMALARHVMRSRGMDDAATEKLIRALRRMWAIGGQDERPPATPPRPAPR